MKFRIPKSILDRGPRWHLICYSRGSSQYPGGDPKFTGDQPPGILIPCNDGTCQHLELPLPEELVELDCYTTATRGLVCPECGVDHSKEET